MLISKFGGQDIMKKVEGLEKKIGQKLPSQLYDFLIKYNGGQTVNTHFSDNQVSTDIKGFLGLGEVKYSYDDVEVLSFQDEEYLPIAMSSFGDDIMINLESGKIFFKNHENAILEEVAEDLRGFIKNCESEGINPDSLKSVEEREQDLIKRGYGSIITPELREMWRAEIDKYSAVKEEEVNI